MRAPDPRARQQPTPKEIRLAILDHLQHLCQTRLGSSTSAPEYGMPDLSEDLHTEQDLIAGIGSALAAAIKRFEPRLRSVRVTHLPSADLLLRYEVTAELSLEGERRAPMMFETRVDASRRVLVL
jgi:type VI secretion system protein